MKEYENACRNALRKIGPSEAMGRFLSKYGNWRTKAIYACETVDNLRMLGSPRRKEYQTSRKKMGVRHERTWLQHTPQGDFVVVSIEANDAPKLFERLAASNEPFDKWFLGQIADVHGIQLSGGMPPTNESYLDIL